MYITINDQTYPDIKRTRRGCDIYFTGGSLSGIGSVAGRIMTYRNDGFLMSTDDVSDYLRAVITDGRVCLTNAPEAPEPDELTQKERRELAYETEKTIEYDGAMITVDEANELWKQYSAEGNSEKAEEITSLIAPAKAAVRARFPEEGDDEHEGNGSGIQA